MPRMPSLFISHGAPNFILSESPARNFLLGLPAQLPARPNAIVMVSAHWVTPQPRVTKVDVNSAIHDFGGFEDELYDLQYAAPGSPEIAEKIRSAFQTAGIPCEFDGRRGLDHGAWIPLMLSWPDTDIPVIQLSMQPGMAPPYHFEIGRKLRFLRDEGALIIGSGSLTHDLHSWMLSRNDPNAEQPQWVKSFADWMSSKIETGDTQSLLDYRTLAPHAVQNHPTDDHILPLFIAMGAGDGEPGRSLHRSTTHGVLRMDAFRFGSE